jgi:arylformamidase
MHIYDVSLTISPDLPVWPGDPKVILDRFSKMEEGEPCNVTHVSMSAHTGTHVDAPFHFLGADAASVDRLSLGILTGRAYVARLPDDVDLVTASVLKHAQIPPRTRRLLLKTRNSEIWSRIDNRFEEDFVGLSADGAQFIVERGIRLVGVDYLSVAPFNDQTPTHQALLRAGVLVVEGLNLSEVSQGRYTLYCLPLKLLGSDGAPARTILVGV